VAELADAPDLGTEYRILCRIGSAWNSLYLQFFATSHGGLYSSDFIEASGLRACIDFMDAARIQ